MKFLDPFSLVVTSSLARLASLVPVRSLTVKSMLKHNGAGGCRTAVPLAESASPIFAIPGLWETLVKLRPEQGDRQGSADFDPEDSNRFV
jgi:hypothetical protein